MPIKIFKEYLDTHKNSLMTKDCLYYSEQKAKEHKEEVLKGCGSVTCEKGVRHPSVGYKCIKISDKIFNYCPSCQEVLNKYDKYEVLGIK